MSSSSVRSEGFVLLEAAVALLIVSLAAVATLSLAGTEYRTATKSKRLLEASALAEDRLDGLRLLRAEELTSLRDSVAEGRFGQPFDGYAWTASAQQIRAERHLFDVFVRVTWDDGSYDLRTRLYRPPSRRIFQ